MKKQFNNGIKNIFAEECPEGFKPGWIKKSKEEYDRINQKRRESCKAKYGHEYYNNSTKNKETCLSKYGSTTWIHSSEGEEKVKETNLKKYGVENIFLNKDKYKQSIITTALNLGYSLEEAEKFINVSQIPEISNKTKETCKTKFGNNSYLGTDECKFKTKEKAIELYGVEYFSQADEIKEKKIKTCIEKYGVPYYCMTDVCRNASNNNSKPNNDFARLLRENNITFEREFRLDKYSYDFKIGNKLIEINPTITHNTTFNPFPNHKINKDYHLNKTQTGKEHGYQVIHLWDWDNTKAILELLKTRDKVYGRECSVKEINLNESKEFLGKYHVQGNIKSSIKIGLYYKEELVSVMTFGKPRYNKNYQYELLRYSSCKDVVGGAEKLFKYFITTYKPESVISYCDYSKFNGEVYHKLGFELTKQGHPSKHWVNLKTGKHITDNLLRQKGFDQLFGTDFGKGTSNEELMFRHDFVEVFDAGQLTFAYKLTI